MQAMQSRVLAIDKRCTDIQDAVDRMQWILCETQPPSGPSATPSFKNNSHCTPHAEQKQSAGKTHAPTDKGKQVLHPHAANEDMDAYIYHLGGSDTEPTDNPLAAGNICSPAAGYGRNIKIIDLDGEVLLQGGSANYRKSRDSKVLYHFTTNITKKSVQVS